MAEGMHRVMARSSDEQENVSPNGAEDADARLQLVPPTPVGMAPLQAAAASVAAKRGMQPHRGQSALNTMQGVLHQTPQHSFDAGAYLQAAFEHRSVRVCALRVCTHTHTHTHTHS